MNEAEVTGLKEKLTEDFDLDVIEKLIVHYEEANDYEELVKLYTKVLEYNPNDTQALNNLAVIYTDYNKDYLNARNCYEQALEITNNEADLHFNYAALLEFAFKDFDLAKTHYLNAIQCDQSYIDAYLNLSWLYLEHYEDYNSSYIVVNEGLKYEENSYLFAQKGFIEYSKFSEYEKAHQSLDQAIIVDPQNDLAYSYLGQLAVIEQEYPKAMDYFEKALETGKLNEFLIIEYGKLLITQFKNFEKAIKLFTRAILIYPDNVIYYCYLANLHFVFGNTLEAKRVLQKTEDFEIESQEALLMIGYLKVMLNENKEEALMYFEKVIELNPNNINALSIIGFYNLLHNHQIDIALDYFKKIADLNRDHFIIYFIIAQIYLQYYQDYTNALEYLLKINTKNLSKFDLSYLYFIIGNIYEMYYLDNNKALDYYEMAYEIKNEPFLRQIINDLYEKDKTLVN